MRFPANIGEPIHEARLVSQPDGPAWIVTGARFGWWHGEEALRLLLRADRRAQELWGIGAKSERVTRQALRFVAARSR